MQEPLRSQYLAALGIENYMPRFILPGARLSVPCEWLDAPAQAEIAAPLVTDEKATAEKVAGEKAADDNQKAIGENASFATAQRAPVIEPGAKRATRIDENSSAKPIAAAADGPKFALSIVLAAGGILLIDDAPASNADRSAYQRLLNNMLPALRPAAAQYVLDIFLWPLTKQSKIPRDAAAAKETLAAYLHKQIQQRAIDTVLLLGEAAQRWCVLESEGDVRLVKSASLLACVRDPALKRPLWNDIRHLGGPRAN